MLLVFANYTSLYHIIIFFTCFYTKGELDLDYINANVLGATLLTNLGIDKL